MKHIFMAGFLILVTISSCNKVVEPQKQILAYFPNDVGNWWLYQVTDSMTGLSRNVKISIHSETLLSNGMKASLWKYEGESDTTDMFVQVDSDFVRFYTATTPESLQTIYPIPFSVGDGWRFPTRGTSDFDTFMVVENISIDLPSGKFDNTFRIASKRRYQPICVHCYEENYYWFKPHFGFVMLDFNKLPHRPPLLNDTWQLIDFRRPMP